LYSISLEAFIAWHGVQMLATFCICDHCLRNVSDDNHIFSTLELMSRDTAADAEMSRDHASIQRV
jgi:hypothetical protein